MKTKNKTYRVRLTENEINILHYHYTQSLDRLKDLMGNLPKNDPADKTATDMVQQILSIASQRLDELNVLLNADENAPRRRRIRKPAPLIEEAEPQPITCHAT